MSGLPMACA
jgi:transposase